MLFAHRKNAGFHVSCVVGGFAGRRPADGLLSDFFTYINRTRSNVMKTKRVRLYTLCIALFLLAAVGVSTLPAASVYLTNMPADDTTLTGDNRGAVKLTEPHVVDAWAKRQSTKPIVVDAGYFAKDTDSSRMTALLKANPYLTMVVTSDSHLGMVYNGSLRQSKTISFSVDRVPVTCFVLDVGMPATELQKQLYGGVPVGTRFTIGFCDENPNEAKQLLQFYNKNQQMIDVLVCRSPGMNEPAAAAPVGASMLIVMPRPSTTMLRLDVSVNPCKVKIDSLSQSQLQNR